MILVSLGLVINTRFGEGNERLATSFSGGGYIVVTVLYVWMLLRETNER